MKDIYNISCMYMHIYLLFDLDCTQEQGRDFESKEDKPPSSGEASECVNNTLKLRQNGHQFADDFFKCIFLNENAWILIKISL